MNTQRPSNPFTQRGMIHDPNQFFGRRAELDRIFDRLRTMQSVSVVGERRIGKSSLLYHLCQTGRERLGANVHLAYTDLPNMKDERSFYRRVCDELGVEGDSFYRLERAVRGEQVILCLDEFEKVVEQSAFSPGFFDSLRSLAQSGNFALVLATRQPITDLFRIERLITSPFWNIFARLDLGLFTQQEAEEFIYTRFLTADILLLTTETDRVLQLAGQFPFFLQMACDHLFEMKAGRTTEWEIDFAREAEDHLRYLWEQRTPPEQAALQWVLGLDGRPPDDRVLWELERRGLLVKDSVKPSGFWVFSEAFENVIRRNSPTPKRGFWSAISEMIHGRTASESP